MSFRATQSGHGYPQFLSFPESLALQITYATRGLVDALRWPLVARTVARDSEIRSNLLKSLILNSSCLGILYILDLLFIDNQEWFRPNNGKLYQLIWLVPMFAVSLYLNSSWCNTIAKRTYSLQNHSAAQPQPMTYTGVLKAVATSAYRIVMAVNSVAISFALGFIPHFGPLTGFLFLCWIDAYYFFEFVWVARGLSLATRVRHLEEHWAYYLAFGLPSAALCSWGSGFTSLTVFALIYPLHIIMAMHAKPVPDDPFMPTPRADDDAAVRHPSPFIPIRLPIFALVMWLNDLIVRAVSVGSSRPVPSRTRAFSDGAEAMEAGGLGSHPLRPARGRINIGRRKMD